MLALEHDGAGIYNIVDDEPARLFAGEALVMMGTESRGASNAKAKRELGWTLRHPT